MTIHRDIPYKAYEIISQWREDEHIPSSPLELSYSGRSFTIDTAQIPRLSRKTQDIFRRLAQPLPIPDPERFIDYGRIIDFNSASNKLKTIKSNFTQAQSTKRWQTIGLLVLAAILTLCILALCTSPIGATIGVMGLTGLMMVGVAYPVAAGNIGALSYHEHALHPTDANELFWIISCILCPFIVCILPYLNEHYCQHTVEELENSIQQMDEERTEILSKIARFYIESYDALYHILKNSTNSPDDIARAQKELTAIHNFFTSIKEVRDKIGKAIQDTDALPQVINNIFAGYTLPL